VLQALRRFIDTARPIEVLAPLGESVRRGDSPREFLTLLEASKARLCAALTGGAGSPAAAQVLTLKVMNLFLARYHFHWRSTEVFSKPLGLVVDPVNNCNLACPGCVHSARSTQEKLFQWNSGMLSEARFEALLRRYGVWALEIMLCNYGEPLMNPLTPRFIRLARTYLMRTGLSTNMTVRRFDAQAYVDSGLDFMTLSLDGATQPVYERYRRKGDLAAAFENIRRLLAARRESGRTNPIVSWQFLAFEHNAHEIGLALETARQLGVDQFIVATPFDVSWDDPGIRPAVGVEPRIIQFAGASDRRLTENWMPFPDDLRTAEIGRAFDAGWSGQLGSAASAGAVRAEHTCHWLYKNLVMDATGRVIPCCAAPKAGADLVFDVFSEADPRDAFQSAKYRLARTAFADPQAYPEAKRKSGLAADPHCVKCEWNQETAHTDGAQVQQYLRTVPGAPFDAESMEILAGW
jgi:MoaA/NifB/PqqE/SkfB family radical SAM enzyme